MEHNKVGKVAKMGHNKVGKVAKIRHNIGGKVAKMFLDRMKLEQTIYKLDLTGLQG